MSNLNVNGREESKLVKQNFSIEGYKQAVQKSLNSIYALGGNNMAPDTQYEADALFDLAKHLEEGLQNFKSKISGEEYEQVKDCIADVNKLAWSVIDNLTTTDNSEPVPKEGKPINKTEQEEEVMHEEKVAEPIVEKDEFTAEEISNARKDGKEVANDVLGFSTNSDRKVVELIIEKNVNSENVLEFLRGFNKEAEGEKLLNRSVISTIPFALKTLSQNSNDGFFKNLSEEWFFEAKDPLMRKVATDLKDYIVERYGENDPYAKEIEVALLEEEWGQEQITTLDNITAKILKEQVN